jgi:hypothetical protein
VVVAVAGVTVEAPRLLEGKEELGVSQTTTGRHGSSILAMVVVSTLATTVGEGGEWGAISGLQPMAFASLLTTVAAPTVATFLLGLVVECAWIRLGERFFRQTTTTEEEEEEEAATTTKALIAAARLLHSQATATVEVVEVGGVLHFRATTTSTQEKGNATPTEAMLAATLAAVVEVGPRRHPSPRATTTSAKAATRPLRNKEGAVGMTEEEEEEVVEEEEEVGATLDPLLLLLLHHLSAAVAAVMVLTTTDSALTGNSVSTTTTDNRATTLVRNVH